MTVPKRSKDAHYRFELALGEWTEISEDEKEKDPPAPRKKLKLRLEKPKERWNFLTEVAKSDLQQKYVAEDRFRLLFSFSSSLLSVHSPRPG